MTNIYYENFLKKITKCPFCSIDKKFIIMEYDSTFLTLAKAPYTEDHLLVIPKRHVVSFLKLNAQEFTEINSLCMFGVKLLHSLKYKNASVLVRNGPKSGKSISHLHYHIIPKITLSAIKSSEAKIDSRLVISDTAEIEKVRQVKKHIKSNYKKIIN